MKYVSTRGKAAVLEFEDVLLTGLASDGGLYVPEKMPSYSKEEIASWASLNYSELAYKIIQPFVGDAIPTDDLKNIINRSYASFRHEAITPLIQIGHNEWILELFHGPTLAFKDVALQLLGHLIDYMLTRRNERAIIMGATSGDTGSAAIEGCRRCENIDIFMLHPHNCVSDVQRKQMTTVLSDNIHNIAIEGDFDDCQQMVKECFSDQAFLKGERLVAVNSINWARIMAQTVYYFYAALHLGGPHREMQFSVPTGNFGDIYAGYLATKMGLPIKKLIIATNKNDILHRCLSANNYSRSTLKHTLSPSMDIMVSSNFERMLFELYNYDGAAVNQLMADLKNGALTIEEPRFEKAKAIFSSYSVDDDATCKTIAEVYNNCGYLLDPHTAVGVSSAQQALARKTAHKELPIITLATAHPAKFPEAIKEAGVQESPELPHHMADLLDREERYTVLENNLAIVKNFMQDNIA